MVPSASGAQSLGFGALRSVFNIGDVEHALLILKSQTALAGDTSGDVLSRFMENAIRFPWNQTPPSKSRLTP
jgi:hypothetical protein